MSNNNNDLILKLSRFAKISSIIGVCLLGVCPPCGAMAVAVPLVLKQKNVRLSSKEQKNCKVAIILGFISLAMFVIDLILVFVVYKPSLV